MISVIIPTYNRSKSVAKAVESVLAQTYIDFELIVIDDGSEDDTINQLKTFDDNRLQVSRLKHSGVSAARNEGVKQCKGDIITFLDSDDLWLKNKLQRQIQFHREHPDILISQTQEIWIRNGQRVNPKFKHIKPQGYIFSESLHLCTITPSSVLMTKELFQEFGGFDENLSACEDYDLWLKIAAKYQVGLIDDYLVTKYGGHEDQLSQSFIAMDRFRIYSLGKLLLSQNISAIQQQLVIEVLSQKTNILLNGAKKRNENTAPLEQFFGRVLKQNLSEEDFILQAKPLLLSDQYFAQ
ncbi:glycosyltransferase [bacterium]|nr:glycosyltransferase [bacterium]